jgi:hypothetical protein
MEALRPEAEKDPSTFNDLAVLREKLRINHV